MTNNSPKAVVARHIINGPDSGTTEFTIKGEQGSIKVDRAREVTITNMTRVSDLETVIAAMVSYYEDRS